MSSSDKISNKVVQKRGSVIRKGLQVSRSQIQGSDSNRSMALVSMAAGTVGIADETTALQLLRLIDTLL